MDTNLNLAMLSATRVRVRSLEALKPNSRVMVANAPLSFERRHSVVCVSKVSPDWACAAGIGEWEQEPVKRVVRISRYLRVSPACVDQCPRTDELAHSVRLKLSKLSADGEHVEGFEAP